MRDDISIDKISDPIFANKNLNQIRMISKIFENAELNSQGNLIWYGVTQEFLDENNGNQDDLEGVCSQLREIENIDASDSQKYYWEIDGHHNAAGYKKFANGVLWKLKQMGY